MSTKEMVKTALFAAIICVLAVISIPAGEIPFTLSVFAIFLTGGIFKPKSAFLAVLCYILIGAIGLPVFSGFKSGFGTLFGITGGYIMAYPFMALLIAFIVRGRRTTVKLFLSMLAALIVCYILGTIWFSCTSGTAFAASLSICVYPFIPFDIIKAVLATIVIKIPGIAKICE